MGIFGLYGSRSAGLYGSGAEDLMKMGRDVAGEGMYAWARRLLRASWHAQRAQQAEKIGGEGKLTYMAQVQQV